MNLVVMLASPTSSIPKGVGKDLAHLRPGHGGFGQSFNQLQAGCEL